MRLLPARPRSSTCSSRHRRSLLRRTVVATAIATATVATVLSTMFSVALLSAGTAHAATDSATLGQVPGYFRQRIGDLTVTALFDGVVPLARSMLKDIDAKTVSALVANRYVPESKDGFQTAVNAYVVQHGDRVMLVDAGTAKCFGPTLGNVITNLRAAGYKPEDVDTVLVTHAHPDHLCGVATPQGAAAFPNAILWLAGADVDFWTGDEAQAKAPAPMQPLFDMARKAIAPYAAAGRLRRFGPGESIVPGVLAVATPGHTPGHTSFLFEAGRKERLLVWGDVLHYHAVQFARPQASFEADTDRRLAVRSRLDVMRRSAANGWWVAGAHLPFPGLGHVRREGDAFAWVPVEYGPVR